MKRARLDVTDRFFLDATVAETAPPPAQLCEAYATLAPILPKVGEIALSKASFWVRMIAGGLIPLFLSILNTYMDSVCSGVPSSGPGVPPDLGVRRQ